MNKSNNRTKSATRLLIVILSISMIFTLTGCTKQGEGNGNEETITLRILENDTAKQKGYLDELLNAFNEAYKDKGIQAVDANMEEYSDLAANGPYGYGPDVIYQANDKLMTYAEDKHILPLSVEEYDCYEYIPQEAWDAFCISMDGKAYVCGIPVNIQEPMLFYREDQMPENWEKEWDDNQNGVADFFENWNDLYAYSKYLRDTDTSANKDSQYGYMTSWNDLYLNGHFLFSYGAYIFGENEDNTLDSSDIGLSAKDSAMGMNGLRQFAALMNEGCIDDTIKLNRYEKIANGSYFCTVSTPDTYSLFLDKLILQYEEEGLSSEEASKKATDNLKMIELPAQMPANGDMTKDSSKMTSNDWVQTIVMGGVNGYGISSYTKHREACVEFVNFATSYEMIKLRMDLLGIAPTRSDVSAESGGITDMIFHSLEAGHIYLMPSIKAIDQVWVPVHTLLGDLAKDPFREKAGDTLKYTSKEDIQKALEKVDKDIYDAIYTLK